MKDVDSFDVVGAVVAHERVIKRVLDCEPALRVLTQALKQEVETLLAQANVGRYIDEAEVDIEF